MTPLRQLMIAAMRQRGFSDRTHQSYLAAVRRLAGYYGRSPAELSVDELQAWFNHLAQERELSGASCRGEVPAYLCQRCRQGTLYVMALLLPRRPAPCWRH